MKQMIQSLSLRGIGIFLSLFVFLIFWGCNGEEESVTNPYEYTVEQKAQILALAEKYGVEFQLDENRTGEVLPTVQEMEKFFQFIANITSRKFDLAFVKEGEVANSISLQIPRMATRSEGGSWNYRSSSNVGFSTCFYKFSLSWKSSGGKVTASIEPEEGYVTMKMKYFQYQWVGNGGLSFTFDVDITFSGMPYPVSKSGSGHVSTKTGIGDVVIM